LKINDENVVSLGGKMYIFKDLKMNKMVDATTKEGKWSNQK